MDSFHAGGATVESVYVDGVSITYTDSGSRMHLWTYVVAWSDDDNSETSLCPCLGGIGTPAFVGSNFYCEGGTTGNSWSGGWYTGDPLWDGNGNGSNCDTPGDPSWFQRDLGQPTSSDIEIRLMADQATSNEDVGVYRMELFVR